MSSQPLSTFSVLHVKRSELGERFTREEALMLATRGVIDAPDTVRLVVVADEDDPDGQLIEQATISFVRTKEGAWSLRYVSHPAQHQGITAEVMPIYEDLAAFIEACKDEKRLGRLSLHCSGYMQSEGMGPLAMLDLRAHHGFAQVPKQADVELLRALASQAAAPAA